MRGGRPKNQRRAVPEVSFARVLQGAAVAGVDAAFAIFIFVVTLPHQFFLALLACVAHVPANQIEKNSVSLDPVLVVHTSDKIKKIIHASDTCTAQRDPSLSVRSVVGTGSHEYHQHVSSRFHVPADDAALDVAVPTVPHGLLHRGIVGRECKRAGVFVNHFPSQVYQRPCYHDFVLGETQRMVAGGISGKSGESQGKKNKCCQDIQRCQEKDASSKLWLNRVNLPGIRRTLQQCKNGS
tara:strand:- start:47 stop:763 length:717 start_codon:yes stop_codon:yes gene_type:complete